MHLNTLLELDKRVRAVVHTREPVAYASSHLTHLPKVSRWEKYWLGNFGISASTGDRRERLEQLAREVAKIGASLVAKYGASRVELLDCCELDARAPAYIKELLAQAGIEGSAPSWDPELGRNASGSLDAFSSKAISQQGSAPLAS